MLKALNCIKSFENTFLSKKKKNNYIQSLNKNKI